MALVLPPGVSAEIKFSTSPRWGLRFQFLYESYRVSELRYIFRVPTGMGGK